MTIHFHGTPPLHWHGLMASPEQDGVMSRGTPYHCNKWGCFGEMRPTRTIKTSVDLEGKHPYSNRRYHERLYRCVECGNENYWLAYPAMDGSFGQVHSLEGGGHSGSSMMSDPRFYPPTPPQPVSHSRRTRRR